MGVLLFILGALVPWIAHYPVKVFIDRLKGTTHVPKAEGVRVSPAIVGYFERYLAFILVVTNVEGTGTILVAWMAAKLAANWQRRDMGGEEEANAVIRANTLIALLTGTLSLLLGAFGGVIARCGLARYGL
jgi:hypothetical protein